LLSVCFVSDRKCHDRVRSRLVRSRLIVWIWPYWQSVIRGLLMLAVVILQAKLAGSRKVG